MYTDFNHFFTVYIFGLKISQNYTSGITFFDFLDHSVYVGCCRACIQMTDLSTSNGRSYGYTGGYRSNYDAASRTFGGSAGSKTDRTLGYLSAYGGVSSLKEKFDVGTNRPSSLRTGSASGYV